MRKNTPKNLENFVLLPYNHEEESVLKAISLENEKKIEEIKKITEKLLNEERLLNREKENLTSEELTPEELGLVLRYVSYLTFYTLNKISSKHPLISCLFTNLFFDDKESEQKASKIIEKIENFLILTYQKIQKKLQEQIQEREKQEEILFEEFIKKIFMDCLIWDKILEFEENIEKIVQVSQSKSVVVTCQN